MNSGNKSARAESEKSDPLCTERETAETVIFNFLNFVHSQIKIFGEIERCGELASVWFGWLGRVHFVTMFRGDLSEQGDWALDGLIEGFASDLVLFEVMEISEAREYSREVWEAAVFCSPHCTSDNASFLESVRAPGRNDCGKSTERDRYRKSAIEACRLAAKDGTVDGFRVEVLGLKAVQMILAG